MANKFTMAQCEFIVRKLAAFEPPRSITIDFCAQHSPIKCTEDDVRRLDPGAGAMLGPELDSVFQAERRRVRDDPESAPFAHQDTRLIALSKQVAFYISNNQLADARLVMRQIAEEQGLVGGKGAGKASVPTDKDPEISAITRTVVDPAPRTEPAQ